MKKRLWFLLLPLGLLLGSLRMQDNAWKETDAQFRRVLLQQARSGSKPGVMISCSRPGYSRGLGVQTPAQLEELLADVHLQTAAKQKPDSIGTVLTFDDYKSDSRDSVSFFFSIDGEQSAIATLDTSGDSALQKWNDFQLTPESVRALKKRVFTLYGKQIEAFQKGKPSS